MQDERDPDKYLAWAIGVGVVLALAYSFLMPVEPDEVVIAAITEEVTERACIAQYAAMDRWTKGEKPLKCALGTRDVPATALSYPLGTK